MNIDVMAIKNPIVLPPRPQNPGGIDNIQGESGAAAVAWVPRRLLLDATNSGVMLLRAAAQTSFLSLGAVAAGSARTAFCGSIVLGYHELQGLPHLCPSSASAAALHKTVPLRWQPKASLQAVSSCLRDNPDIWSSCPACHTTSSHSLTD
jgi:hypothetical protein